MLEAVKLHREERQVRGSKSEGTLQEVTYLISEFGPEPAK
jgi:hypothetical protein